ncbi:3-hydroxyisobutyryl-CoA hydrolase [Saitoella coloradoensis]
MLASRTALRFRPVAMPLRAKITNPAFLNGSVKYDVLFESKFGTRTIILNRPKKLNSLTASMVSKITPRLQEWEKSDLAKVIVLKGAGRALCAGGDVVAVASDVKDGTPEGFKKAAEYFGEEYKLDHLIASYTKPYVAIMDGITMGGGVGLSMHAPIRIATENTLFAMPETTIGFFPDVGASFFLSRLDGKLGTYLGMTSAQLKGWDVVMAGVATHFVPSERLPMLETRLAELETSDLSQISEAIDDFVGEVPKGYQFALSGDIRKAIDRCFNFKSVKQVIKALEKENTAWAHETIGLLRERSPRSLAVTLRQLRDGSNWDIDETFKREFIIASRFVQTEDFVTGVEAKLVLKGKDRPNWQPANIEDVDQDIQKWYFDVKMDDPELELLPRPRSWIPYKGMPHHRAKHYQVDLPNEAEVKQLIEGMHRDGGVNAWLAEEVVDFFVQNRRGRAGVAEKVRDILARKTKLRAAGERELSTLMWVQ